MAIWMGFGGFHGDPNVGGQFTLAGSPKAQLIMIACNMSSGRTLQ